MEEISVLIKYRGVWVQESMYETSSMDGVVVRPDISFKLFKEEIASQIGVDHTVKNLRLRYVLEGHATPMEIRNSMGVKLYLSLIKNVTDMLKFSLCVTYDAEVASCSVDVGVIGCVELGDAYRPLMLLEGDGVVVGVESTPMKLINVRNVISNPCNKVVRVKQTYLDKKTLVSVMHNYALDHRFQFYAKRSCKTRYVLTCYVEICPWYFRASKLTEMKLFKVREFNNNHTCPLGPRGFTYMKAWCDKEHTHQMTKDDILNKKGVDITYMKAWRDKELAMKMLLGRPAEGYIRLPVYLHVLGNTYPDSYIRYHKFDVNKFMYLFIALGVSIRGFDHCRPIVVVDGSALKGPYLGTFISASTLDGAGNILPLAYGVVDTENDASWTWFFNSS